MREPLTNDDAAALALSGLDGASLRARVGEPAVLAASLAFLQGHQADLVACAGALGTTPDRLVAAQQELER